MRGGGVKLAAFYGHQEAPEQLCDLTKRRLVHDSSVALRPPLIAVRDTGRCAGCAFIMQPIGGGNRPN